MKRIIWNQQGKIRLPWRLVGHLLILVVCIMVLDGLLVPLLSPLPAIGETVSAAIVSVLAFTLSVWLAGRWLDKRDLPAFGLHFSQEWWRQFLWGMGLGAVLMAGIFLLEWGLGYVEVVEVGYTTDPEQSLWLALLLPLIGFLGVAVSEELLFRGYYMRNLTEGVTGWLSLAMSLGVAGVLSSVVFGLAHAGNPAATPMSTFYLCLLGLFFAYSYALTGELAIPMGVHWTWNYFQGNVFGFPVSGWSVANGSVLRIVQTGPEWLTGGTFGPEAGVLGVLAMLIGCVGVTFYARQGGNGIGRFHLWNGDRGA